MTTSSNDPDQLVRRLERERRARREAERIAEQVTANLYATTQELHSLNDKLAETNVELQSVNQSIRDFVAVASHDIRGPLTSILGFASILVGRWDDMRDEDRRNALDAIVRQGKQLNQLVGDLLTISTIEAGALDVHREVVTLRDALQEGIDDFSQHAGEIRVSVPLDLSALVDPNHLRRILVNYVTNAFKYGQPPVEIEASDSDGWVEIRVRDCGAGVPEDFLPRLFGRFARAPEGAAAGKDGTGLGLSIVQGLARANGGDTWYEPNSPSGSCFGVRLPKTAA
ncbi:MAG TPA: HAMP domain-containing sensor histidine kinase [Actinomycetota bacterium]